MLQMLSKPTDKKIGDLSDLNTTDKSSIVNAINELAEAGATSLYGHTISLNKNGTTFSGVILYIVSAKNTPYTTEELYNNIDNVFKLMYGMFKDSGSVYFATEIYKTTQQTTEFRVRGISTDGSGNSTYVYNITIKNDSVIKL